MPLEYHRSNYICELQWTFCRRTRLWLWGLFWLFLVCTVPAIFTHTDMHTINFLLYLPKVQNNEINRRITSIILYTIVHSWMLRGSNALTVFENVTGPRRMIESLQCPLLSQNNLNLCNTLQTRNAQDRNKRILHTVVALNIQKGSIASTRCQFTCIFSQILLQDHGGLD